VPGGPPQDMSWTDWSEISQGGLHADAKRRS
jgi:hypothetical protein